MKTERNKGKTKLLSEGSIRKDIFNNPKSRVRIEYYFSIVFNVLQTGLDGYREDES